MIDGPHGPDGKCKGSLCPLTLGVGVKPHGPVTTPANTPFRQENSIATMQLAVEISMVMAVVLPWMSSVPKATPTVPPTFYYHLLLLFFLHLTSKRRTSWLG
ncbi:jg11435 [Pararge aegeria aegeria]|uniref:Jg11435 protein n=1 Tax=Pararge aegeria aegeria TaxID=348720 RepID=A0A8S4RZ79_9NEOP|nr:jg11435 [Pararge aegeria aegeria]